MDDPRDCPDCHVPMDAGVIVGRSPGVKFKANRGVLGDLTGVRITTGFFNHSANAWRCPSCRMVVVPPVS